MTKAKNDNAWIDEIKSDLCRVLSERHELVTIFKFDSKKHNGNLEDAILEALLNGKDQFSNLFSHNFFSI